MKTTKLKNKIIKSRGVNNFYELLFQKVLTQELLNSTNFSKSIWFSKSFWISWACSQSILKFLRNFYHFSKWVKNSIKSSKIVHPSTHQGAPSNNKRKIKKLSYDAKYFYFFNEKWLLECLEITRNFLLSFNAYITLEVLHNTRTIVSLNIKINNKIFNKRIQRFTKINEIKK